MRPLTNPSPSRPMLNLDTLLTEQPKLHRDLQGNPVSWGISAGMMRYLDETVRPGMRTLETGAGYSTLVFAMRGAEHIAIMPDGELAKRLVDYCSDNGVDPSKLNFKVDVSERVLPHLDLPPLDLVLIDGRHGFPAPFIDWYYTAGALNIGGLMIVDDTQLWTGQVLREFLSEDDAWSFVKDIDGKTAIFRKEKEGSHDKEWRLQNYVRVRSEIPNQPAKKKSAARRVKDVLQKEGVGGVIRKAARKISGKK